LKNLGVLRKNFQIQTQTKDGCPNPSNKKLTQPDPGQKILTRPIATARREKLLDKADAHAGGGLALDCKCL